MPTAILRSQVGDRFGNVKDKDATATITHNNARLYHANGRTYEYVGDDRNGNRIYRDTSKQ
jgi:hypothetical protein